MYFTNSWKELEIMGASQGLARTDVHPESNGVRIAPLSSSGRPLAIGFGAAIGLASAVWLWANFMPYPTELTAYGSVETTHNDRAIIHPDGGTIASVETRAGSFVKAGQVLFNLDGMALRAELKAVEISIEEDEAVISRINAIIAGASQPTPSTRNTTTEVASFTVSQSEIRTSHQAAMLAKQNVLQRNLADIDLNIRVQVAELARLKDDVTSTEGDLYMIRALSKTGDTSKLRLNEVIRAVSEKRSTVSLTASKIASLVIRRSLLTDDYERDCATEREALATERSQAQRDMVDLRRRSAIVETLVKHLVVRAPFDGFVSRLYFQHKGENIAPGAAIADVSPVQETTELTAHLNVADYGLVTVGQEARVRVIGSSSSQRESTLAVVSSVGESLLQEKNGDNYFQVNLRVAEQGARVQRRLTLPGVHLQFSFLGRRLYLLN